MIGRSRGCDARTTNKADNSPLVNMGNCLKRAAGNQQDNTTLLSNNPESNVSTSGSSQEGLGPPIVYNVIHA